MIMKMMMIIAVSQLILKVGTPDFALQQIQIVHTDDVDDYGDNDDDDNNDEDDDDDDYSCKSVNFKGKPSRFCIVVDLDSTYR